MKHTYRLTARACFVAYFTQAIAINVSPLLYVTFQGQFGLSLSQIGLLIASNFTVQLLVDFFSAPVVRRIGTRASVVAAHVISAIGLGAYTVLPFVLSPFFGLLLAVVLCGIGGGLIEVLVSPLMDACPTPEEKKSAQMSLLHSFYSWGQATVIGLSTLYFTCFGITNWRFLPLLWAIVPATGAVMFCFAPIYPIAEDGQKSSYLALFRNGLFWCLALMMLSAGASEMVMSQWSSTFAELGLGVQKTVGDLLGPFAFAILMAISRVFYSKMSGKLQLHRYMTASLCLCIVSYLVAALSPLPLVSLVGCAVCGLSVGVLWPGTFSSASAQKKLPGGISLFALLAFFGDVGCLVGPAVAGTVADAMGNDLHPAFLVSLIFPVVGIAAVRMFRRYTKE